MDRAEAPPAGGIVVIVACSPGARQVEQVELRLPCGATVADALRESGLLQRHPELAGAKVGVWGRLRTPQDPLRDGDRVELVLPLRVDPKTARRLRARRRMPAPAGGRRTGPGNAG